MVIVTINESSAGCILPRSRVWIAVVLSLFMFQSIWNVAAAFCTHEPSSSHSRVSHFGHHSVNALDADFQVQTPSQDPSSVDADSSPVPLGLQDHHHHLLSCVHVVLMHIQQQPEPPLLQPQKSSPNYDWSNGYQSPQLSKANPPPVLTPLSVG